jgi:hypothetical protein
MYIYTFPNYKYFYFTKTNRQMNHSDIIVDIFKEEIKNDREEEEELYW